MTAQERADRIWAKNATPWVCAWCDARSFATERGRARHELYCTQNPAAKRYTEGGWDGAGKYEALLDSEGYVIGAVWRGDSEDEGERVKQQMRETLADMGIELP